MQNEYTAINNLISFVGGSIHNGVNCFVECRIRIQVSSKTTTDTFQESDQVLAGEMLRSVERHMFQEVSQTLLVIFFQNRTHLLSDVKVCTPFRFGILTYDIG